MLALHGAVLLVMLERRTAPMAVAPVEAVLLDLTPATPPAPLPLQPAPETPPFVAPDPPVVQAPPPRVVAPAAVLPLPPRPAPPVRPVPPPRPVPTRRQEPSPVPSPTLDLPRPRPAPVPSPAAAAPPGTPGPEAATWPSRVASHLLRFRRYPQDAERRGFTGVTMMRFSVDAAGRIVSASMVRSSGHDVLDEEAVAWLQRAAPLPPPPPDKTAPAQVTVPLSFVLR